jgi:hypothetical protein
MKWRCGYRSSRFGTLRQIVRAFMLVLVVLVEYRKRVTRKKEN